VTVPTAVEDIAHVKICRLLACQTRLPHFATAFFSVPLSILLKKKWEAPLDRRGSSARQTRKTQLNLTKLGLSNARMIYRHLLPFSIVAFHTRGLTVTNGFHHHQTHQRRYAASGTTNSRTTTALRVANPPNTPTVPPRRPRPKISPGAERRAVLAQLAGTAAAMTAVLRSSTIRAASLRRDDLKRIHFLSLDQTAATLAASCDRRFLHAVIASDYRLMYRGIPPKDARRPAILSEPSDLLSPLTYGSAEAAAYFRGLEATAMADAPIRPSNGHLATTNPEAAAAWGRAASVWPLGDDVHFAWLAGGGDFWPPQATKAQTVVVDGVDCGRDSLEDALEKKNSEIMFRADRYLVIPVSMQDQLISRLRKSFII